MSFKKGITFDFGGYDNSRFCFDYMLVFIKQVGLFSLLFFTFACLTISHDYSTLLIKKAVYMHMKYYNLMLLDLVISWTTLSTFPRLFHDDIKAS